MIKLKLEHRGGITYELVLEGVVSTITLGKVTIIGNLEVVQNYLRDYLFLLSVNIDKDITNGGVHYGN